MRPGLDPERVRALHTRWQQHDAGVSALTNLVLHTRGFGSPLLEPLTREEIADDVVGVRLGDATGEFVSYDESGMSPTAAAVEKHAAEAMERRGRSQALAPLSREALADAIQYAREGVAILIEVGEVLGEPSPSRQAWETLLGLLEAECGKTANLERQKP